MNTPWLKYSFSFCKNYWSNIHVNSHTRSTLKVLEHLSQIQYIHIGDGMRHLDISSDSINFIVVTQLEGLAVSKQTN